MKEFVAAMLMALALVAAPSCKTSVGRAGSPSPVGGRTGAAISARMSSLRREMPPEIATEAIGRGEALKATMLAAQLFASNSSRLNDASMATLRRMAEVLNRYPGASIHIVGHTDRTGSEQLNLTLSQRRARSVADALAQSGVDPARISCDGRGFSQPKTTNATPAGRALNRRIEIFISAGESMLRQAQMQN